MAFWADLEAFTEDTALLAGVGRSTHTEALDDDEAKPVVAAPMTCDQLVARYPFTTLFDSLREATTASDARHVELLRMTLAKLFTCMNPAALLAVPGVFTYLQQGLLHPSAAIRDLAATTVSKCLCPKGILEPSDVNPAALSLMTATDGFCVSLIGRVTDVRISVAERCVDIAVVVATYVGDSDAATVVSDAFVAGLRAVALEIDAGVVPAVCDTPSDSLSVLTSRLLDATARLAGASNVTCRALNRGGLMSRLAQAVGGDDILLLMNTLQHLTSVAKSAEGCRFIVDAGVLSRLLALAGCGQGDGTSAVDTTVPDPFVGPQAIESVGELFSKCVTLEPGLVDSLRAAVVPGLLRASAAALEDDSNEELSVAYMSALANVVATDENALGLLLSDDAIAKSVRRSWLCSLVSSVHRIRAAALHAVGVVLEDIALRAPATGSRVVELCVALVSCASAECGKSLMSVLLDALAQPVDEDSRFGAMHVLRGLALFRSGWGLKLMFEFPGFIEFFTSRTTEFSKEGRLWKAALIEAVRSRLDVAGTVLAGDLRSALTSWMAAAGEVRGEASIGTASS